VTEIVGFDIVTYDTAALPPKDPIPEKDERYDRILTFFYRMLTAAAIGGGVFALKRKFRPGLDNPETAETSAKTQNIAAPLSNQGRDFFYYGPQDSADIHRIITCMADKGLLALGYHAFELNSAGNRIGHLTPFAFIMVIYRDPELRRRMNILFQEDWKWNRVVGGIASTTRTKDVPKLLPHVKRLAQETGKDEAVILGFLQRDPPDVHSLTQYIFNCQKLS
jgi:hypothetical protein